ncbi:hypothetical protein [Kineococcus rhizosphaerae]|uniref:Uncharacterized protein n=1 Tax=Kineococcus rhizosphaerae TaxID=559628 RepID=A0A2T0RAH8_9ACTN|nr:hypothetical protein [Kineococcus rhizosphaerae]PRY18178.1 hypothetical protein CLV37_101422 [Kineococcus rhizosphaerae]
MLNVPSPATSGELGLSSATRDPSSPILAQAVNASGTALAREARARQSRILASLTVSDRSFLGVVLGPGLELTDSASLDEIGSSALAAQVAADRDSGLLPQGCPIDIAYVRFLAGFDVEDEAGTLQPLLSPRQHDRARRYLEQNGGRATIDFRT